MQEDLRYPIGQFQAMDSYTPGQTQECLASIAIMPHNLTKLVEKWDDHRLDTPYRPGGWTVRQVVHHVVDSHLNGYIRHKLTLTEDNPVIKPYQEARWAELTDYGIPVAPSLSILSNLHHRWVTILKTLSEESLKRTYVHPEIGRTVSLAESIANYAWHGKHHYQHIYQLAQRNNWV